MREEKGTKAMASVSFNEVIDNPRRSFSGIEIASAFLRKFVSFQNHYGSRARNEALAHFMWPSVYVVMLIASNSLPFDCVCDRCSYYI